ncbi:exodeoxyribonuclease I [Candidatus Liberibacter americanus]|uniref:Exodeoxyribonuclease I n=1 Tax=Candidatus Liberibacter americanus str. Sao Paulo TaxID=1261131 RepID=U6B6P1_9HYPH|nr:exodeoxyribonuclease I [Candidatus Liberibacter americanus]AHA27412.1 Exonuclease I [Candidatus Liberibacter americanus str. Sao Paulo]EMS36685.1 exonuclease I [Candidatus Liberibacter americanus PW_SP]
MNKNFLIYDYETFGNSPSLDRPSQFAAIIVDNQFEKIEDSKVFFCKPADDYIPDPDSVLITGITPQQALREGLIESEFARHIHEFFSKHNTCIVGYNNIRFDDEYSRNIFYRNFYDPYSWSWKNANSRWDLLNVVRACYAFRPHGINWPIMDDGLPSFKLEDMLIYNGFKFKAHDAEMDVRGTLEIARLVRRAQPKLFDYFYNYRNKDCLRRLINIDNMDPLLHVSGMFGAYRANTAMIAPIAWHPIYNDYVIVCDLSGDMQVFRDLDSYELRARLYTSRDELNGASAIPLKLVHLNKCPIIAPITVIDPSKNAKQVRIDKKRCLDNLKLLCEQSDLREKVISIYDNTNPFLPLEDVDTQLYDGFFCDHDRKMMDIIISTEPEKFFTLDIKFIDKRLNPLFFRYRARNFPHTLDNKEKDIWMKHIKNRFTQPFIDKYVRKLINLYLTHKDDENKRKLIIELFDYLKQIMPKDVKIPVFDLSNNYLSNSIQKNYNN